MTLPTITKSPLADAIRAIAEFKRQHQGLRPNVLICGSTAYREILQVGTGYLMPSADPFAWTIDGVPLSEREAFEGYTAAFEGVSLRDV